MATVSADHSKRERDRRHDAKRRAEQPWRRWYQSPTWQAIRRKRLGSEPLCRECKAEGRVTAAQVVDHIEPHRGETKLFFSYENTQPLCKHHHNATKQQIERIGYSTDIDVHGNPKDKAHPFNR